ncbi:hypothetical protein Glove_243g8 [Diversispora epigaea]|uniref:Uncharacterized protein n=1 Tax=Diversispora epigaea TaxID=1348612 RepID=A0A397IH04_9GLOM|nr:hypothetical protein Glove_243g8 [Diversispora epigaea]
MSNDQLTINTLRELNSRFASEITELRKENAEIPEFRKKFSEVEAENIKLKAENIKLKQALEERESRFVKLEQNDKDTAVENAELKARVAKLEQKQSQTNEKNNFIVKSDDDAKGIDQSSVNTISTKMKNSNDTPASNISDNTSNSDVAPERIENSSNITSDSYIFQEKDSRPSTSLIPIENGNTSEEKAIDEFLDSKHRETVSKEIIQSIKEKKLRDQEKIITSQGSLSVKGGQELIQELFTSELSLQESKTIPRKSNFDEASQHLAQLCDKAFDAEDGANKANQEEILCWSIYRKDFRLSIIRKKRSQELDLHLPEISRDALCKKTQRAEKIYILFKKIGHDKIKYIKSYSANSISKLTNDQIQEIINYSCQNVNTDNAGHQISSENTEISETEIETSNITTPSIPFEDVITSESLPETETKVSISMKSHVSDSFKAEPYASNEGDDYYGINSESLCPICKLNHEDREGVEGNYKAGSYYIKCEASEIDMIQYIDRASSADAEIIV